jgi:hypothetical protein
MHKKRVHPNTLANLKPIKPGEVRNPGGRRPIPEEVKQALLAATPQAVSTLIELMANGGEKVRVQAASIILDRVYGKAAAQVDVRVTDVGAMHLQLLEEIRARRQERLGQAIDVTPTHTEKVSEYEHPEPNESPIPKDMS